MSSRLAGVWADLADLVLPADCAGCGARAADLRYGVCPACVAALESMTPIPARPTPAPADLPPCMALGDYGGVLREVLLGYKERGRHTLARPLGALLGHVVVEATGDARTPVLLVPVPATAAAVRRRHGDHMRRLAQHAADRLGRAGRTAAVARPLRALPRPDSAEQDSAARAATAEHAFRMRRRSPSGRAVGARVVLLDDIVTTGATLSAVAARLAESGVRVHAAAVLAATVRRTAPVGGTEVWS